MFKLFDKERKELLERSKRYEDMVHDYPETGIEILKILSNEEIKEYCNNLERACYYMSRASNVIMRARGFDFSDILDLIDNLK